ncbi:hypothetical protein GCM10011534_13720 [Pseudooceanicola nanhaiensis]|jgi:hypothetical protein|uniref:Uncharacterized protein n=1 Tax=Pseudooceanicola nanhaiensis TaxID=375761 RepID=A0A917SQH8_9RHOB|nr:hypothetical protein [Pseudooceanicola nanhaiensis]GGL92739.1 hypothetical protein GCM10011534_13720 [Pseudooceanicola nanhaiensis]
MTNVVHLTFPSRARGRADRLAALTASFAADRRSQDDVFWLKENAELLNIFESTGAGPDDRALAAYAAFYDKVEKRLAFFPQYYRFLLSMTLDLEDLGMPGDKGEALVHWASQQGLAEAEISDLQRAEARRLMCRRGCDLADPGLTDRLLHFIARPATFAMPNKKAAYELTHTIFYLTEYGRQPFDFGPEIARSLAYGGTLAYLDRNADLLAEICVALRFAACPVPMIWDEWLSGHTAGFVTAEGDRAAPARDDYHEFLVCNWSRALAGAESFAAPLPFGPMSFHSARPGATPLRQMSQLMLDLDDARSGDWHVMRGTVEHALDAEARDVLQEAEAACPDFDGFFAGFARAGQAMPLRMPA